MADKKITIRIQARDTATRVLRGVRAAGQRLRQTFVRIGQAIGVATVGLGIWARTAVTAFMEQEDAVNSLSAALTVAGNVGADSLETLTKGAQDLQRATRFADEELIAATARLSALAPALDTQELLRAQKAMVGIASVFTEGNLESAALAIGKSLSGTRDLLALWGIGIGTTGDAHERLNRVMERSANLFEIARAEAGTTAGAMDQLGNAYGDLKEQIGAAIVESVTMGGKARNLTQAIFDLTDKIEKSRTEIVAWIRASASMVKDAALIVFFTKLTAAVAKFTIALGAAGLAAAFWTGGIVWAGALAGVAAFAELRNRAQEAAIAMREAAAEADRQAAFSMNIPTSREGRVAMRNATSRALQAAQEAFARIPEAMRNILPSARDLGDEIVALSSRLLYLNKLLQEGVAAAGGGGAGRAAPGTDIPLLSGGLGTGFGPLIADQLVGAFDQALDAGTVDEMARLLEVHLEAVMGDAWAGLDTAIQLDTYFANLGKEVKAMAVDIGENMVLGIIQGTLDMGEVLKRFLIGFALTFIMKPLKIALDLKSPSGITYGYGQNLALGMILGMDSMGSALTAATGRMADTVTGGLSVPQVGGLGGVAGQPATLTAKIQTDDTSAYPPWALDWLARANVELRFAGEP